jgi:hypothetical protein
MIAADLVLDRNMPIRFDNDVATQRIVHASHARGDARFFG